MKKQIRVEKIVKYYLDKGKRVFFFPDANLGKNTSNALNLKNKGIDSANNQKSDLHRQR